MQLTTKLQSELESSSGRTDHVSDKSKFQKHPGNTEKRLAGWKPRREHGFTAAEAIGVGQSVSAKSWKPHQSTWPLPFLPLPSLPASEDVTDALLLGRGGQLGVATPPVMLGVTPAAPEAAARALAAALSEVQGVETRRVMGVLAVGGDCRALETFLLEPSLIRLPIMHKKASKSTTPFRSISTSENISHNISSGSSWSKRYNTSPNSFLVNFPGSRTFRKLLYACRKSRTKSHKSEEETLESVLAGEKDEPAALGTFRLSAAAVMPLELGLKLAISAFPKLTVIFFLCSSRYSCI
jgi:hypothetical protein